MTNLSFKELPLLFCLLLVCLSQQLGLISATENNRLVVDHRHETGGARTSIEDLEIVNNKTSDGERSGNAAEMLDDTSFPTTEPPKQSESRTSSADLNDHDADDQEKKSDNVGKSRADKAVPSSKNKSKFIRGQKKEVDSSGSMIESSAARKQISKVGRPDKNKKDTPIVTWTNRRFNMHYQDVKDTDTIVALVVTKKGSFGGRKLNNKAIDKILSFGRGPMRIGNLKSLRWPLSLTSVFPSGTYQMKRAIRFAGLHLV